MPDQADQLRSRLEELRWRRAKVIAVASGKGGVGKSNFSINFAVALARELNRVLIIDFDIGMGNVNILVGKSSHYTIADHFEKAIPLHRLIEEGPSGVHYIGGGTGLSQLLHVDRHQFERFSTEFELILKQYDYIFLDMGAGYSEQSIQFMMAANEVFIITTPEPTSITDAYSMMKFLAKRTADVPFYLICNRALSRASGEETLSRLAEAARQFLNKEVFLLGVVPDDSSVGEAVLRQIPFIDFDPKAGASLALNELLHIYLGKRSKEVSQGDSFISRIRRYLFQHR
ncbi:cobyrinic acid a,c-diamide synthase [Pradoshia eiseniae]|uniref:Cobyrinic acid a,c-diamide synthase n=1 Tax=Pradoshia eiseniae TaxID=2064768 RepID=A0A2S7N1F5_9BACI|nr:MinD/ParA family protein [Pradoshia eiseniae]PQD95849.1 cobyrinic acid a,c-diamide synthase [Pradoshia eiseniae]